MPVVVQANKGPSVSANAKEQIIEWCPISSPSLLPFTGTSFGDVHRALAKAFGDFPIRLTREHLPTLKGMECAAGDGAVPYRMLYTAVDKFNEIEVR